MSNFTNKIDFEVLVMVKNANPNGDPLNGNRPREIFSFRAMTGSLMNIRVLRIGQRIMRLCKKP